jgi:tetratricopeptide (TPR) repeat protein
MYGSSLAAFHARLPRIQVETIEGVVGVALRLSKVLGRYYTLIFFVMITAALFLMGEEQEKLNVWIKPHNLLILPVGLLLGIFIIRNYSYDLIRADIVFKQGNSFASSRDLTQKQIGIAHLEQSIELAPREDYYHLFLGKAYLELTQSLPQETPPEQREDLFRETERVLKEARGINPLNTDHSANLARFYRSWSQSTSDPEQRQDLLELSQENYEKALTLSPNNAVLWNELAILYAFDLQNMEKFQETISHSLDLDPEFEQTWMTLGDVRLNVQQDQAGAIEAYQEALTLSPKNCAVRYNLGNLLIQESEWAPAIETLKSTDEYCAGTRRTWDMYRLLAIAYYYEGQPQQALQMATQALQLAPEDQRGVVEQLITAIQQPEEVEPVPEPGG